MSGSATFGLVASLVVAIYLMYALMRGEEL
jgi:hypothetical protein